MQLTTVTEALGLQTWFGEMLEWDALTSNNPSSRRTQWCGSLIHSGSTSRHFTPYPAKQVQ
eukprot:459340-Amphidinium_carterae.1